MSRHGGVFTPHKTRQFESTVALMARGQMKRAQPLTGPLKVILHFILKAPLKTKNIYPCVKPDLDNLIKAVTDALNGIAWEDDKQIAHLEASKIYASKGNPPKILVIVEPLLGKDS